MEICKRQTCIPGADISQNSNNRDLGTSAKTAYKLKRKNLKERVDSVLIS